MEHGLYVLEGKAVYRLNQDWVEVEAGDYMWLRAFCPQACYAGGPGRFRYLLYKDVNRHAKLGGFGPMSKIITAKPLTRESFAPFGEVIDTGGDNHYPINGGKTDAITRWRRRKRPDRRHVLISLAKAHTLRFSAEADDGRAPSARQPGFRSPMQRPFLVVVCHDENGIPGTPHAFLTEPGQGMNYRRNPWHGVLTPIGEPQDFLIVDRGGEAIIWKSSFSPTVRNPPAGLT